MEFHCCHLAKKSVSVEEMELVGGRIWIKCKGINSRNNLLFSRVSGREEKNARNCHEAPKVLHCS